MAYLIDTVSINPKFRSAVRLDRDFETASLNDYVVHETASRILESLFDGLRERGSLSVTLTGPYGSGKSSLALFLSTLIAADPTARKAAAAKLSKKADAAMRSLLGARSAENWMAVHVVGRRAPAAHLIRTALREAIEARWPRRRALLSELDDAAEDGADILTTIKLVGAALQKESAGLLLVVDEMGKTLEHATFAGGDIHLFQDLAETVADCGCRSFLVGILHQSFEEYARALGGRARDEWAKIQGRFEDIPFSLSLDESVTLISNALLVKTGERHKRSRISPLLDAFNSPRLNNNSSISAALNGCWPLHPLTALLLAPISRRGFGQNERSIFSFLASRDPGGFVDFLETTQSASDAEYSPSRLWDYLQHNFEAAILSSRQDSKAYSEAVEAVDRAAKKGAALHVDLAKTIALLDLFGKPFGLIATEAVLTAAFTRHKPTALKAALQDLAEWSIAIFRSYSGAWGVFAGSDIDLNDALDIARDQLTSDETAILSHLPALSPIVAKKHYHETGTLRWFERLVVSPNDATQLLDAHLDHSSCAGVFVICSSREPIEESDREKLLQEIQQAASKHFVSLLVSFDDGPRSIAAIARELAALNRLKISLPALAGDAVARRELAARCHAGENDLIKIVDQAFASSEWRSAASTYPGGGEHELSRLASDICETQFNSCPRIFNELINRDRPSANVAAARRKLMYAMLSSADRDLLGIEGFPPEMSLYLSLFKGSGLHARQAVASEATWGFATPPQNDPQMFSPLYEALNDFLRERHSGVGLDEIYDFMRRPPFGLRNALAPIILLHFAIVNSGHIALYREGFFTPDWSDEVIDQLLQRPESLSLRWFAGEAVNKDLLRKIANFVECRFKEAPNETALDVTKPLVQFALRLPPFVRRTNSLSATTKAVRDALTSASDPFTLLFDALPAALGLGETQDNDHTKSESDDLVARLGTAVAELANAEAKTVASLKKSIFGALQAGTGERDDFEELRSRARLIPTDTGDERLNGLISRARNAEDSDDWIKAVASLGAGKPYRSWTDADVAAAKMQLIDLGRRFQHVESFVLSTRKRGKTVSFALTVQDNKTGVPQTISSSLTLNKKSQAAVDSSLAELRRAFGALDLDAELKKAAAVSMLIELEEEQARANEPVRAIA